MNPRPTPKVGDILYSLNIGNASRHTSQVLTPVQVFKVGRLYFTCGEPQHKEKPHMHSTYHLDGWREKTDFTQRSELFTSPQEWEDLVAAMMLRKELNQVFCSSHRSGLIPLAALREIRGIVEVYTGLAVKS